MTQEFQAQRAKLQSELSSLALAGADTSKVRDKLAKLDEREQATRDAEAAAIEAARQDRLADARSAADRRVAEITERLEADGHELTDSDRARLAATCQHSAELFAELGLVRDARSVAARKISEIAGRIGLLEDRRGAIAELSSAGQSTDRDLLELRGLELDAETLRAAKADAQAQFDAIVEPADKVELRRRTEAEIAAFERDIQVRSISASIAAQEAELLGDIQRLVQAAGARIPAEVYHRTPAFDLFVRTGQIRA